MPGILLQTHRVAQHCKNRLHYLQQKDKQSNILRLIDSEQLGITQHYMWHKLTT